MGSGGVGTLGDVAGPVATLGSLGWSSDLSDNAVTGMLPSEIGHLSQLSHL